MTWLLKFAFVMLAGASRTRRSNIRMTMEADQELDTESIAEAHEELDADQEVDVFINTSSGFTELTVRVIVMMGADGRGDGSRPWYNSSAGTMPLNSRGDIQQEGSLATDLSSSDIREIFAEVNRFYEPAKVRWNVQGPFFEKPTVPCNGVGLVCERYKCRSYGYFTRYWGTINKQISKSGREERATNMFSMIPNDRLRKGRFHMVYTKFLGWKSQGVVFGTRGSSTSYLRPNGDDVSIATCGQWSNKFTSRPSKRPNVVKCDGRQNCGFGLAYTTAHELGHLFGLQHTDPPSIMTGGGSSASSSRFSSRHIADIQRWISQYNGEPRLISSYDSALSGSASSGGKRARRNNRCS